METAYCPSRIIFLSNYYVDLVFTADVMLSSLIFTYWFPFIFKLLSLLYDAQKSHKLSLTLMVIGKN